MIEGFNELETSIEPKRKVLYNVAAKYPNIHYGKYYDYKAKKVGNYYQVYRRELEGEPWEEYGKIVIVDGIMFTNFVGMGINQYGDK